MSNSTLRRVVVGVTVATVVAAGILTAGAALAVTPHWWMASIGLMSLATNATSEGAWPYPKKTPLDRTRVRALRGFICGGLGVAAGVVFPAAGFVIGAVALGSAAGLIANDIKLPQRIRGTRPTQSQVLEID